MYLFVILEDRIEKNRIEFKKKNVYNFKILFFLL
jgi:hypothetical protein